jgi:hypothetical protein
MVQFSIFGIVFCWFTLFHLTFCCFGWLFRYLIPFLTNCSYLNILYVRHFRKVAVVLCGFAQHFYCHTIKSASTRYPYYIGRLLYALGAVVQGRVANEIPIQRHSPCFGTLIFFMPQHNGAPNLCGASSDDIHTFKRFVQTGLRVFAIILFTILLQQWYTAH